LSSSETFASSAITRSSGVRMSGLISASVASSARYAPNSATSRSAAPSAHLGGQVGLRDDLERDAARQPVDALGGAHHALHDRPGIGPVDLLDVDPALTGADDEVALADAVVQHREVVLLGDVRGRLDVEHPDLVALDVEAEDRLGGLAGLVDGAGEPHTAGLAATSDLDLRLDHDRGRATVEQALCRRDCGVDGPDRLTGRWDGTPLRAKSCLPWNSTRSIGTPSCGIGWRCGGRGAGDGRRRRGDVGGRWGPAGGAPRPVDRVRCARGRSRAPSRRCRPSGRPA
jgi:hypothetical protein